MSVTSCEIKRISIHLTDSKTLKLRQRQLTDRNESGIPSLVTGPMPSIFFGGVCVDVIFFVSSILLSLVSLFKSRLME